MFAGNNSPVSSKYRWEIEKVNKKIPPERRRRSTGVKVLGGSLYKDTIVGGWGIKQVGTIKGGVSCKEGGGVCSYNVATKGGGCGTK